MTRYNPEQIQQMKEAVVGSKVTDMYYESDGDYFVLEFDGEAEMCFRYMADLVQQDPV